MKGKEQWLLHYWKKNCVKRFVFFTYMGKLFLDIYKGFDIFLVQCSVMRIDNINIYI